MIGQSDGLPAPGSDEAVAAGCRCPVMDNRRGRGYRTDGEWIMNIDCPIHGNGAVVEEETE